ncbi:MAG: hypothetical protein M3024_08740 [Candidatus Dormibacteraeota bacterium]|nr:hypothetical protein [Candidatus Dormibacteraeota bacterium]
MSEATARKILLALEANPPLPTAFALLTVELPADDENKQTRDERVATWPVRIGSAPRRQWTRTE